MGISVVCSVMYAGTYLLISAWVYGTPVPGAFTNKKAPGIGVGIGIVLSIVLNVDTVGR
jgi:hypothetical protein